MMTPAEMDRKLDEHFTRAIAGEIVVGLVRDGADAGDGPAVDAQGPRRAVVAHGCINR